MTTLPPSTEDILLVPSAIQVPDELRLDVGSIPAGMIPLEGEPMLEHIADAYSDYNLARIVAVGESADSVHGYVSRSDYDWTVVNVSHTSSLGETVHNALDALSTEDRQGRSLYINFADTLIFPLRPVNKGNIISYKNRERTYRWTTFDIEEGEVVNPKQKRKQDNKSPKPCFTGQFGLVDADRFYQTLNDMLPQSRSGLDFFYRGLLSYLESSGYKLYEPDSWLDVGHLDTYHRAKKQFLNSREFNELENHGKNIITKRSEDTETLINEIRWYNEIPSQLQPYLPRIYDYSTDEEHPYVKMEYIGYPSLSDLQLYGSHRQHIWNDVFHQLFSMHHEFQAFTAEASPTSIQQSLKEMYLDKTKRRLDRLRGDNQFQPFFEAETVQINGEIYPTLDRILDDLEKVINQSELLSCDSFTIIHGDLCLPNILYDPRNEILKLIDPRGRFGEFKIYGDHRYDIAKLRHSFVGHYEHLINGQFEASSNLEIPQITYDIYTTKEQKERENRFDSILARKTDVNVRSVKLIESLLFLSMVPLHSDSYNRQLCMLAQGVEKFSSYIS